MSLILNGDTGVSKVQDGVLTQADIANAINVTGDAPIFGCRAWVNFDGTRNVTDTGASTNGQPVKIRASGNVTSVTKNATGDYTVFFTTAMPDANFATFGYSDVLSSMEEQLQGMQSLNTTTSCKILNRLQATAVYSDAPYISVSVFR